MSKIETNTNYAIRKKRLASTKKKVNNTFKKKSIIDGRPIQYVLPIGNGWVVKTHNASRFTVITDSKKEAISIARNLAKTKHTELVVHAKNGNIELRESYVQ